MAAKRGAESNKYRIRRKLHITTPQAACLQALELPGVRLKLPVESDENPKRQSTAALQNLSDSWASAKLREVLECGCALPLWLEIPNQTKQFNPPRLLMREEIDRQFQSLPRCKVGVDKRKDLAHTGTTLDPA